MDEEIKSSESEQVSLFTVTDLIGEPFRKVKDSLFRRLFSEPEYLLRFYQALHPEDTETTENNLELVTLETVIVKDIHNDLGLALDSGLLILAEAQSTWSVNIIVRSLLYLARTYQNYLQKTRQSLYNTRPVSLPKAELYVIYTGHSEIKKDEISLSREFFHNVLSAIEIKVKVLVKENSNDIINQYIVFSMVFDEQIRLHGRNAAAVEEAIRICKSQNILKEFLEQHEKEAVDIMVQLYSQEEAVSEWGESRYAEGLEEKEREISVKLYASGWCVKDISALLDRSIDTISEWLRLSQTQAE